MTTLWNKLLEFVENKFNVIIVAILCVGFLGGIYVQGNSHDDEIDEIRAVWRSDVELRENEFDNLFKAGDALFKAYTAERHNSELKDQIIEKQYQAIEQLLKQLNNKLDISRWI